MEITVFEGELKLGNGANATMVFAQDFRVIQCARMEKKLAERSGLRSRRSPDLLSERAGGRRGLPGREADCLPPW
jgi:hypothetical protein